MTRKRWKVGGLFDGRWMTDMAGATDEEMEAYFDTLSGVGDDRDDFAVASDGIHGLCERIMESESPEDMKEYARKILILLIHARGAIEEGNAVSAARYAFRAGQESETMRLKFGFEVDAVRGQKVAGGARNSAHATNARHAELRKRRFERMEHHIASGLGVESAAYACEDEGLGGWQGIKKQWDRYKNRDR